MQRKIRGQMSETFLIAGILSVSGGLQDAYTYMYRGKVFANAQTGNFSVTVFCTGCGNGGMHPHEIPEGTENPLEAAGACNGNSFIICSRILPE